MASRRRVGQCPDCHTFLCKFWHFQMAVSCIRLGLHVFTPNLGILQNFVCTLWLCGSIVASPIIYRLKPSPSRFETRQWLTFYKCQFDLLFIVVALVWLVWHTYISYSPTHNIHVPQACWLRGIFYFTKGNRQYRLLLNSGIVFTGESNTIFSGGNPTSKPFNTSVIEAHSIPRPCVKRQEIFVNNSQGYF